MALVTSHPLPPSSRLHGDFTKGDFLDCYAVETQASPRALVARAFAFPHWVSKLLALRNVIVGPMGLQTPSEKDIGEQEFPFPLIHETHEEMIFGFDDKHLNFKISVLSRNGLATMATWVHPHNLGGWLYLRCVLPFHIVIVRNALRRAVKVPTISAVG